MTEKSTGLVSQLGSLFTAEGEPADITQLSLLLKVLPSGAEVRDSIPPSEVPLGVGLDGIATLSMGISPGSKGEALLLSKETTASSVNPCNSSTLSPLSIVATLIPVRDPSESFRALLARSQSPALLCHANNSLCFSEACNLPVLAHFVSINILRHFSNPYPNGSLMTTFQSDWSQEETVDENRGLAKLIQQKQN